MSTWLHTNVRYYEHFAKPPLSTHGPEVYVVPDVPERNGPNGYEYYYEADSVTLRATKFVADVDGLRFVDDRPVLDLSGSLSRRYMLGEQVALVGDELALKYFRDDGGELFWGTLRIRPPGAAEPAATDDDDLGWANSPPDRSGSCGYAMSRDGRYLIHNVGDFVPLDQLTCYPHMHNGFCVVPFTSPNEPAQTREFIPDCGFSVNWIPPEYRDNTPGVNNDFNRWDFTNNSDYIVGCVLGDATQMRGMWLIEWSTNTWTSVTPRGVSVAADYPAVHFGRTIDPEAFVPGLPQDTTPTSTVDPADPCYEVVRPNGGETWQVGDTCEVVVRSYRHANAVLYLTIDGEFFVPFPGLESSFDPRIDSVHTLVVPDSFTCHNCIPGTETVPSPSSHWQVLVSDYMGGTYSDWSDDSFTIR